MRPIERVAIYGVLLGLVVHAAWPRVGAEGEVRATKLTIIGPGGEPQCELACDEHGVCRMRGPGLVLAWDTEKHQSTTIVDPGGVHIHDGRTGTLTLFASGVWVDSSKGKARLHDTFLTLEEYRADGGRPNRVSLSHLGVITEGD
jgi:hypothetical protein